MIRRVLFSYLLAIAFAGQASADFFLNAAQPITGQVNVQPILVRNDDGSNAANFFGDATQQTIITTFVNQIWAQAGLRINFLSPNTWNNTFANVGSGTSSVARPTSDLSTIVQNGDLAGVGNANPFVIDMYFVKIAAGFPLLSENTANGLAFVNGNGITQHVGFNLLSFTAGQEVIAKVVAHEIGHNLGLPHLEELQNLMQSGGTGSDARLNAAQVAIARGSQFITAVPEPTSFALVACIAVGFVWNRRRANVARHSEPRRNGSKSRTTLKSA